MNKEDLDLWTRDPVTMAFFSKVSELKTDCESMILDSTILSSQDLHLKYAKLLGYLDALKSVEDLELIFNL